MADYLKIENYSKNGTLGISREVFELLASEATNRIQGANLQKSNKNKTFTLAKPVTVTFSRNGKVDVKVAISLMKKSNAKEVCTKIQEEIANTFLTYTESVQFDINIKIIDVK